MSSGHGTAAGAALLEVRELSVDYAGRSGLRRRRAANHRALDGVSVSVMPEQTVAVVGESGAGKSTLGRAVLGLVTPSGGTVRFEGADITRLSHKQRLPIAPRLQAVFQDPYSSLNPARTVGDSLVEPLLPLGWEPAAQRQRVALMLERVGLEPEVAGRYPRQFSGGQRQRIAIARALMPSPRLVICDEALSALDLSVQAQVINLLLDLQREMRLAYLFISHDLSVVRHLAHRVVVMRSGRVVEEGSVHEVCEQPGEAYTRSLIEAAPVPDPALERERLARRVAALSAGGRGSAGVPLTATATATTAPVAPAGTGSTVPSATPDELPLFDPDDPAGLADPEALYGPLRERSALARSEAYGGFYAALRHAEVQQVMSDAATWSAAQGVIIPRNPASGRRPPLHYDPPEHTAYRRVINPVFRPDRLRRLQGVLDSAAAELITRLRAGAGTAAGRAGGPPGVVRCDLYRSFCSPYASRIVCELLNVPAELHDSLADDMEAFESAQRARDHAAIEAYNLVLYDTARRIVALRASEPLDPAEDLVSALLGAADAGVPTDPETVAGSLRQILVAGHGAPALVIAGAAAHLASDRSLQEQWRNDPSVLSAGAEEMLRLHTPNAGFARTAVRETVLAGRRIEAGSAMAVVLPAANLDPAAFERPHELVPGRKEAHLAFGYGPHRCPGSVVGRGELVAALRALLETTTAFELDGEIGWSPWPTAGPVRLPLRLTFAPPCSADGSEP